MGSNLDAICTVVISATAPQITRESFGTPIVLSDHNLYNDRVRAYSTLAGLTGDGFSTTSPEYLALEAIFEQQPSPPQVLLGRRANRVTQKVDTTIESAVAGVIYGITLNGVDYTYTATGGDTATTIATALYTALGTQSGLTITNPSAGVVRVVASAAGTWFRISGDNVGAGLMSLAQTHADPGIAADLAAIYVANNTWYAATLITEGAAEIEAAAAWIEANGLLMVTNSQDSQIILHAESGASDVAYELNNSEYFRTALLFCGDNGEFSAAAWLGDVLPDQAGTETWAFKSLAGIAPDVLTTTQVNNLQAKCCNYYQSIGGDNITQQGKVAGNDWIDTIRGRDALVADIQENVVQSLLDVSKIPFTDGGANTIAGEVQSSLSSFVNQEPPFLSDNPKPTVTVPLVANVSGADKTARLLPDVTFTATLAGAIQVVNITGTVTV